MKDDAGKIPRGKKWAWNKSIRTQENTTRWKRISLIWFDAAAQEEDDEDILQRQKAMLECSE